MSLHTQDSLFIYMKYSFFEVFSGQKTAIFQVLKNLFYPWYMNGNSLCPFFSLCCEGQRRCCFLDQFSTYSITVDSLSEHYLSLLCYGFILAFKLFTVCELMEDPWILHSHVLSIENCHEAEVGSRIVLHLFYIVFKISGVSACWSSCSLTQSESSPIFFKQHKNL